MSLICLGWSTKKYLKMMPIVNSSQNVFTHVGQDVIINRMVKNIANDKLKNQSKRNLVLLYILVIIILAILFFAVKWSIENVFFKDFFQNYKF